MNGRNKDQQQEPLRHLPEQRVAAAPQKIEKDFIGRRVLLMFVVVAEFPHEPERVGNVDSIGLETTNNRNSSWLLSSLSSAMKLTSKRQMRQSQYDAAIIRMLRRLRPPPVCDRKREWPCSQFSDMVLISLRPGDDAWRFRKSCPEVLRAGPNPSHAWSEKRTARSGAMLLRCACEEENLLGLVGVTASTKGPRQSAGARSVTALEGSALRWFGSVLGSM